MKSLLNKNHFIGLDNITWFYSGAETPPLKGGLEVVKEYYNNRSQGPFGRYRNTDTANKCKENIAELVNGQSCNVAIMSNSSEIISMITNSINLKAGDNVIVNNIEYASGVLPSLAQKDNGIEVRVVKHKNWEVSVEDIMEQIDSRTRLVVTSYVSYLSGARIDYKNLYKQLENTDVLLLLDVTQALGAVPVDIQYTDFLVCSSYKWLLSSHGVGILVENRSHKTDLKLKNVGWRSIQDMFHEDRYETFSHHKDARRFELGFPSYPVIYNLSYSTQVLLEIG